MSRRIAVLAVAVMLVVATVPDAAFGQDKSGNDGVAGGVDPVAGAVWAEVWTSGGGWHGSPTRCTYVQWSSALVLPGAPPRATSKDQGGYHWSLFFKSCAGSPLAPDTPGRFGTWVWIPTMPADDAAGGLGGLARVKAIEIAPKPVFEAAPGNGFTYVKLGMWFWTTTSWEPIVVTASVVTPRGWRWVTVTATPTKLVFEPGDGEWGTGPDECVGPGEPWVAEFGDEMVSECMYTYLHSSRVTSTRQLFKPTLSIEWVVTFKSSSGRTGTLDGFVTANTAIPAIEVREIHAVVVS